MGLSIAVQTLGAGVAAQIPVSEVSYILLTSSAQVDDSGRYRLTLDSVVTTDGTSYSFEKSLQDSFGVETDSVYKESDLGKSDSFSLTDSLIRTLVFVREFADAQGLSDASAFSIAKQVTDLVTLPDALQSSVDKNLADAQLVIDLARRSVSKTLVDAIASADAQSITLIANRADLFALADTAIHEVTKGLSDQFTSAEQLVFSVSKLLSDGFAMNDGADVADGIVFIATKSVANVAFAEDSAALLVTQARADSVSFSDSGLIVQQDYCDLTYFAEDYVGSVTTF